MQRILLLTGCPDAVNFAYIQECCIPCYVVLSLHPQFRMQSLPVSTIQVLFWFPCQVQIGWSAVFIADEQLFTCSALALER